MVFDDNSSAFAGICFLPDCMDEDVVQGDFNMNLNEDSEYCEKEGYTYYISGKCPQYQDVIAICPRDDHYLKCDAETWCKNNGYNTTSCSLPSYLNEKCPNDYPLYKECKEDPNCAATPAVCDYGCSSYNSCGICTICKPAPCRYGITAEDCASDCMNVGSQSCTRNGITYYASCGSSKCSSSQSCIEGNCYTPSTGGPGQRGSFICCDTVCNDYTYCKKYGGYEDCSSVMPSYTARGCDFTFGYCRYDAGSVYTYLIYGTCAY